MLSDQTSPLVSIITPTFNRAQFLGECIESVLGQTYTNIEHLLVDDGSTDNTTEVVRRYPDNRIQYTRQENRGQATARNVGLRMAKGQFICFLDSDNVWKLHKIERQLQLMQQLAHVDILYGAQEVIDENSQIVPPPDGLRPMTRHSGRIMKHLLLENCVSFNTAMVRRQCFDQSGGFDENVRAGDDYDLWLRLSAKYEFLYIPEVFGQYRVMQNQISSDKERRFNSNKAMLERFIKANPELVDERMERFVWSRFHVRRGRERAAAGKTSGAMSDYLAAIRLQPLTLAPWRALARLAVLRK
jgi:glycosyltransferase involved in cell wall biosynthesis